MKRLAFLLGLALLPTPWAYAEDDAIEVFTDISRFPLLHADGAVVYDLSASQRLLPVLPADPPTATSLAKAWLAANADALRAAYAGHGKAAQYGITKIPAVVFGHGQAVVYGVPDVAEAAALHRRWRGQ